MKMRTHKLDHIKNKVFRDEDFEMDCGHTRLDHIKYKVFRDTLGVDSLVDMIREWMLRWFGCVKRGDVTTPVKAKAVKTLILERRWCRCRPKLTWDELIMHDLLEMHFSKDMIQVRVIWKCKIKVKDF